MANAGKNGTARILLFIAVLLAPGFGFLALQSSSRGSSGQGNTQNATPPPQPQLPTNRKRSPNPPSQTPAAPIETHTPPETHSIPGRS